MKAQDYLGQLERLNTLIENKKVERLQWEQIAMGITAGGESVLIERIDKNGKVTRELHNMEKVQSSGSQSKMADAVIKCVAIQEEIDHLIGELIDKRFEIIRTIEMLKPTEYDVLHKRYIQDMSFKEIGAVKGKSESWATTVHGRALQGLQRILDEREQKEQEAYEHRLEKIKEVFKPINWG